MVALGLVFALLITYLVLTAPPAPPAPLVLSTALSLNESAAPRTVNASFWGINVGPNVPTSTALAQAVSESPARVVRFPGGAAGDQFNYTSGTLTNDSGVAKAAQENLTEFVAWCQTIACSPILELPGEIDSPATAAYYVAYVEGILGVHPIAWEIGNEPALWTHFALPWSQWSTSQRLSPSPLEYAREVQQYVAAIHRVDPVAPILGLPGVGTGSFLETSWINATVSVNGPNLTGVGIHAYPAGPGPGTTATEGQFLENVSGERSLAARIAQDEAAIALALPSRAGLPIYVTELGTGLAAGSFAPFLYSFPSVPFTASEIVAALESGVASVELAQVQTPHGGSWMDGNGTVHPLFALYSQLLPQLGTTALPVTFTPSVPGVSAVATYTNRSGPVELLLVNANATVAADVDVAGAGLDLGAPATRWSWNSSTLGPVSLNLAGAASVWDLPPVSVLLVKLSGGFGGAAVAPGHAPRPLDPANGGAGPIAARRIPVLD